MSTKDMIKHARNENLVKFGRSFKSALKDKIPAAIHNERVRVANLLFNRKPSE